MFDKERRADFQVKKILYYRLSHIKTLQNWHALDTLSRPIYTLVARAATQEKSPGRTSLISPTRHHHTSVDTQVMTPALCVVFAVKMCPLCHTSIMICDAPSSHIRGLSYSYARRSFNPVWPERLDEGHVKIEKLNMNEIIKLCCNLKGSYWTLPYNGKY